MGEGRGGDRPKIDLSMLLLRVISRSAAALSAACAKCGRNSNPLPFPFNFLRRGRSTSYDQPAVAAGLQKRETTAPHGKLYRRAPPFASKSISFYSFEEGTAIIAQLPLSRLASWDECASRQCASNEKADVSFILYICVILKSKFYLIN